LREKQNYAKLSNNMATPRRKKITDFSDIYSVNTFSGTVFTKNSKTYNVKMSALYSGTQEKARILGIQTTSIWRFYLSTPFVLGLNVVVKKCRNIYLSMSGSLVFPTLGKTFDL